MSLNSENLKVETFDLITQNFCDKNVFALFGFGEQGKTFLDRLSDDINIQVIYDNDKQKHGVFKGKTLIKPFENDNLPVLITTSYNEISKQLTDAGLTENVDFCDINKFVSAYYLKKYNKFVLPEIHLAVTTKCTLNCKHCNMFLPYYKTNEHENLETLKKSLDDLFKNIDKVLTLNLLGGEPFLSPDLDKLINYIYQNHAAKIGKLILTTNGTLIPNSQLLALIKKHNIQVNISDYTCALNYDEKLNNLKKELENYEIDYFVKSSLQWLDFLFPEKSLNLSDKAARENMLACNPVFKGVNDSKFYYCHIVWSAVKAGLINENPKDFIDISNILSYDEKIILLKFSAGLIEENCTSLCKHCAGCSHFNNNLVDAAIQAKRSKHE